MTGSDFLWFLESIWFDLTNLGTADLPSLFFRLVGLFLLVLFGALVLRTALTVLWRLAQSYLFPLLRLVWDVLTAPVWYPYRLVRRAWRSRQDGKRYRAAQEWERQKREEAERERLAAERRERERIAELQKILKVD